MHQKLSLPIICGRLLHYNLRVRLENDSFTSSLICSLCEITILMILIGMYIRSIDYELIEL